VSARVVHYAVADLLLDRFRREVGPWKSAQSEAASSRTRSITQYVGQRSGPNLAFGFRLLSDGLSELNFEAYPHRKHKRRRAGPYRRDWPWRRNGEDVPTGEEDDGNGNEWWPAG
jgi:hypothetical protein